MTCDICDFAGASVRCSTHPLTFGVVKELHHAILGGQFWGNIVYEEEVEMLASMSVAQKAALEVKKAAEEQLRAEKIAHYSVDKRKKLYTNQTTGLAPIRFGRHCKKERYHGEMCPNKLLASTTSCDPKYGCGCRLHKERKGACSFVHADEEDEMVSIFANFGMKILDDKPMIDMLIKMDQMKEKAKANPAARYVLEKEARELEMETDAIEMRFKNEQRRCKLWQIVNANGTVSYTNVQPDSDAYSAKSSGHSSNSGGGKLSTHNNAFFKKTTDNGSW